MLEIKDLTVKYHDFIALNIPGTITVEKNDFVGIIGSNGAGKSTLVKAITGQVSYTGMIKKTGKVSVHLQENAYPNVVSCQVIMEGLLKTQLKTDKKLLELVEFFDFKKLLTKKFSQLSGGQKQRLTLIMVLYEDSPLTCFDEMTAGLDFEARNQLMKKIKEWYSGKDASLLFITHYFSEIEGLVNKLFIIDKGHIVDYGTVEHLFKKYVGFSAIIVKDDVTNEEFKGARKLISDENEQAFSFTSKEDEENTVSSLISLGKQFAYAQNDFKLIYLNALNQYNKSKGILK